MTEGPQPRGLGFDAGEDIDREAWTDPELDELLDQETEAEVTTLEDTVGMEDDLISAGLGACAGSEPNSGSEEYAVEDLGRKVQGTVSGEGPGRKVSAHVRVIKEREEAARVYKPRPRQRFSLRDLKEVKEMVDNGAWNLEGQTNDSTKGIDGQDERTSAKDSSLDNNLLKRPRMDDDWWSKVKKSHEAQRAVAKKFQVRLWLIIFEGMKKRDQYCGRA
jgi:hypothetical protein